MLSYDTPTQLLKYNIFSITSIDSLYLSENSVRISLFCIWKQTTCEFLNRYLVVRRKKGLNVVHWLHIIMRDGEEYEFKIFSTVDPVVAARVQNSVFECQLTGQVLFRGQTSRAHRNYRECYLCYELIDSTFCCCCCCCYSCWLISRNAMRYTGVVNFVHLGAVNLVLRHSMDIVLQVERNRTQKNV